MYSLTKFNAVDYAICIPNLMGIGLFAFQILVWLYFYKKKQNNDNGKEQLENKLIELDLINA